MLSDEAAKLRKILQRERLLPGSGRCLVALSGGSDSTALLYLMAELRQVMNLTLTAAHLNHNLRPEAQRDADFAADICRSLAIPLKVRSLDIAGLARDKRMSLEEAGRWARHSFFAEVCAELGLDAVLTAHTADDQAETVLMRIISGTGLSGLGGIRYSSDGLAVHPLLDFTKEELRSYLIRGGISWCEDSTNHVASAPRTKVRLELLPLLKSWNPRIADSLVRLASLSRDEDNFLDETAESFFVPALITGEAGSNRRLKGCRFAAPEQIPSFCALPASVLAGTHPALRRRLIRKLFNKACSQTLTEADEIVKLPAEPLESVHCAALEELAAKMCSGKRLPLPNGMEAAMDGELLKIEKQHQDRPAVPEAGSLRSEGTPLSVRLCGMAAESADGSAEKPGKTLVLESRAWHLKFTFKTAAQSFRPGPDVITLDPQKLCKALEENGNSLTLRPRKDGDRFFPAGGRGTQKIKKYLQQEAVPSEQRGRLPLLCCGEEIIWIPGLKASQKFLASPGQRGVLSLQAEEL